MKVSIGTVRASGQIEDSNDAVLVLEFHARSTNEASVYVGMSDVSSTNGRELPPGESCTLNFAIPDIGAHRGSMLLNKFYADISNSDELDWVAIIRGE